MREAFFFLAGQPGSKVWMIDELWVVSILPAGDLSMLSSTREDLLRVISAQYSWNSLDSPVCSMFTSPSLCVFTCLSPCPPPSFFTVAAVRGCRGRSFGTPEATGWSLSAGGGQRECRGGRSVIRLIVELIWLIDEVRPRPHHASPPPLLSHSVCKYQLLSAAFALHPLLFSCSHLSVGLISLPFFCFTHLRKEGWGNLTCSTPLNTSLHTRFMFVRQNREVLFVKPIKSEKRSVFDQVSAERGRPPAFCFLIGWVSVRETATETEDAAGRRHTQLDCSSAICWHDD